MNFFREKPLCLMILVMLGGFSLFSFDKPVLSVVLAILCASLLLVNCIFKFIKKENYPFHILLFVLLSISVLLSHFYFNLFRTIEKSEPVIEAEIIGTEHTEYQACYHIKCNTLNGNRKNVDLILTADKEYIGFDIGDIIVTKVSTIPYDRTNPEHSFRMSQGFVGEAEHISQTITRA